MVTAAPTTRATALASAIENSISEQSLGPGDPLGTIAGWQDRSGFSRATVSEAVRLLVDRGAAEIRPGRNGGLFVASVGSVVRLRHTLLAVHGEASTLADAIVIREALEPPVILDAARSRTAAQSRGLRSGVDALSAAVDDHDAFLRAVWALHESIAMITPNEMLRALYLTTLHLIDERSERARSDSDDDAVSTEYRRHRVDVHRELVEAIADGSTARVEQAILRHRGDRS